MNTNMKYHTINMKRLAYKLAGTTKLDYYQAFEAIEDRVRVLTSRGFSYSHMMKMMDRQIDEDRFFSVDNIFTGKKRGKKKCK